MDILAQIKSMLADSHDPNVVSSKRVITLICVVLMVVGFIGNMFFKYAVDQHIFDSIMYVVIATTGATGLEKFAPPKK